RLTDNYTLSLHDALPIFDLNEQVTGRIIRVDREGAVIYTDDGYRGFIHNTEREKEPRLGQSMTGRIIEVKEDGSLNISLLPMKQDRKSTRLNSSHVSISY